DHTRRALLPIIVPSACARPPRLRRCLADHGVISDGPCPRASAAELSCAARFPGPRFARQTAPCARAPRWASGRRDCSGRRRSRVAGRNLLSAPLPPHRTASRRAPRPHDRTRRGRNRLCVYLWLGARGDAAIITAPMSTSQDTSGASVLVVDDEPTIGEVLARYLERAGFDTRTAH